MVVGVQYNTWNEYSSKEQKLIDQIVMKSYLPQTKFRNWRIPQ